MSATGDGESGPDRLVDALAELVGADVQGDLAAEAVAAGEDVAAGAADLRERFLDRIAAARKGRASPNQFAATMPNNAKDGAKPRNDDRGEAPDELAIPSAIGRYPILNRVGAGGMGVVYAAYDEALDRRIAIKVLHPRAADIEGRRRERLLREAQAMARVTHPNVITVHEVGTEGGQVFVAMEFVAGPTLDEWLHDQVRGWREIVAIFRQAAEGLAALHDAGLIHRDVKPSNMIIGDDGRVRVLDLGLAGSEFREIDQTIVSKLGPSSSVNRVMGSLTSTGERIGTPAYMSREQFLGLELTPASDLFSLCIVLYEALHDVHPFLAPTFSELQANVLRGSVREPIDPGAVPAWLHALVLRGLALDPKARPASMHELSAALGREPTRRLRRWVGTLGIAAVATLGGVAITQSQAVPPEPSCDGGVELLAAVWGSQREAAIEASMVTSGRPYAQALAERVTSDLASYAATWTDAHGRACREHARGDYSDALFDARVGCLERRRQALDETATILSEADVDAVENAGQMVARLPSLGPCDDLEALATRRAPPEDPRVAAAVSVLESRLVRAEAQANAGRVEEAVNVAHQVAAEAASLEHPATVAAALLTEARAFINASAKLELTADVFSRALAIGIAEGLETITAEAMIGRLYVTGLINGRSAMVLEDLPLAEAMLIRAGDPPELRALLLNNSGAIHLSAGDREGARVAFEAALAAKERSAGPDHLDNAATLANLSMLTTDAPAREALHRRMLDLYEGHLGPLHPKTLDGRFLVAMYTADPARAAEALRDLCQTFTEIGEESLSGECLLELGRIEDIRGRQSAAVEAFESARPIVNSDNWPQIDAHRVLVRGGDPEAAIALLRSGIAKVDGLRRGGNDWWLRLKQAERRTLLARLLAVGGAPVDLRIEELEESLRDLEAIAGEAPPIERARRLAVTQSALAQALRVRGEADDISRATTLEALARAHYRRWPDAYRHRL